MFAVPRRDLREYLAQVPDPRGRKGKRHAFTATLTAVVCAILQKCRGYEAIAQWLEEQPLDFLWTLGFTRRPPTETGVRRLLSRIDVAAFEAALTRWITDVLDHPSSPAAETETPSSPTAELKPTAMDGKALRGTWERFARAVQLLTVIDTETKCVLHQRQVPDDTNEHHTALEVLKDLVLKGRVITADALFCHQDVCETIVASDGHYVLPVKENQETLLNAISLEFQAHDALLAHEKKVKFRARRRRVRPPGRRQRPSAKRMIAKNAGRSKARPR